MQGSLLRGPMGQEGMNFIGDQVLIRLELKYCERCGGLWVRRSGLDESFCGPCARVEAQMPERRKQRERRDNSGMLALTLASAAPGANDCAWLETLAFGAMPEEVGRA